MYKDFVVDCRIGTANRPNDDRFVSFRVTATSHSEADRLASRDYQALSPSARFGKIWVSKIRDTLIDSACDEDGNWSWD